MNFTEYLNSLYAKLDCTQVELCNATGLSAPVISRYISGDREPAADSEQLKALTCGICNLAGVKALDSGEFDYDRLLGEFNRLLQQKQNVFECFIAAFGRLVDMLDLNMRELAGALNFDVSYLYRIRAGERHPVDLDRFCKSLVNYIVSGIGNYVDAGTLAGILECSPDEVKSNSVRDKLYFYLTEAAPEYGDIPEMTNFLSKMENFNLNGYIKEIHFDEFKVPSTPFQLPTSKYYYGVADMRKAELDFLKATVLGKSTERVFMCSYMPMQELAEDMGFGKKWMFGIAMMIKKGLHLDVIHNLDRPMHELMLGFEAWIPLYMTGQVHPYCIYDYTADVFHQINNCSGSAALMGECIDGFYKDGRYYVTNNKTEVAYFRKKADALLQKADPLMDIYTEANRDGFRAFIDKALETVGTRRIISSVLPDFTIPTAILEKHITGLSPKDKSQILAYIDETKSYVSRLMAENTLSYDVCELSREEYEQNPVRLSFPIIFKGLETALSYEEYIAHLKETVEYAAANSNFKLNYVDSIPFKNIRISIVSGKYFIISKSDSPNIHFVIYNKKMLQGMENFYIAYKE